jgi:hypothetical protein
MSRIHSELTSVTVTAEPKDSNGDAYTPTTAEYRVDDCRSGEQLVDWTTLTPSTSMTITIPGSANAIIHTNQDREDKVVTVRTDKDLATQQYSDYKYQVKNLGFAQVA